MADAVDDGSSSRSRTESASGSAGGDPETREVRCVVHNFPEDDDDAESTIRSLLEPSVIVCQCQLSQTGKHVQHLSKSLKIVVQAPQSDSTAQTDDELTKWLEKLWCQRILGARMNDLWLEIMDRKRTATSTAGTPVQLALSMISLGDFTSSGRYVCHWKSSRTPLPPAGDNNDFYRMRVDDYDASEAQSVQMVRFEYDNEIITVTWTESATVQWRMEISFDSLVDRVVLVTREGSVNHLYLFIVNQPKVYGVPQRRHWFLDFEDNDAEMVWKRDVCFGSCSREVIGSCNAIHLEIDPRENGNIDDLLQSLNVQRFILYAGNPETVQASRNTFIRWPRFETFEATYAWYCLVTRGFKVTDQISDDVIDFLKEQEDEHLVARMLYAIGEEFDNKCVVTLCSETLRRNWDAMLQYRTVDDDSELSEDQQLEHMVKVRRLLLTPTVLRALPAEHIVGNRVVREFGVDLFVRVVLRDENMELLSASACSLEKPVKAIIEFMRKDLAIGDRRYHFLGCSNSQMREHGFWMYSSDGRHTVFGIRQWMGDLSHERCVATYVSRLGQFFSASRKAVNVEKRFKRLIPDVERSGHCFTDGIGMISSSLSEKVAKSLHIRSSPSAFQIRYGGCKGVVSVCPDLEADQIHVRKSMEKFKSDHCELEVVQYTKPGRLYLNRQVIVLMSGLGVRNQAFFALQDNMLQQLADMLIRENSAIDALAQTNIGISPQQLLSSGICVTKEPFLSSVLRNIYEHKLNNLMKKTRIEIPTDDGRIMMGTADETSSLCYGEVFVQFSVNIDHPQAETKILEGPVVIAKNPCFHPGDMRKFRAVNKPQLKHMIDCVVFPTQGSRPHPDEMSGSDLDGDMYFVCWNDDLLPPDENKDPMNYEPKPKQVVSGPLTESDIIEFIGSYIAGDTLGVIANSHLAHADGQESGIFSQQCLSLAQMHSDAVDFPKTGLSVKIPPDLRPRQYPHYMLKRDKPLYTSKHILGKLYDQCYAIMSNHGEHVQDSETYFDNNFLVSGYETYLKAARRIHDYYRRNIARIMGEYGITTEAEVATGHIIKLKKQRRGTLQREHVEIVEIINSRLQTIKAKVKEMFIQAVGDQSSEHDVELSRMAAALYFVTYSKVTEDRTCLSLPWIFVDHLLSARRLSANPETLSTETLSTSAQQQTRSVLHELSKEVVDFKESDHRLHESRIQRNKAFQRLANVMSPVNSPVQVVLSVFGSHATGFDDASSCLDVLFDVRSHDMSEKICDQIISAVKSEFNYTRQGSLNVGLKPVVLTDSVNRARVCLYTSVTCIRRTVYIIAAVTNNSWIIRVLQVIMCWAKENKIAGNNRDTMMTAEQLVLLFLSHVSKYVLGYQSVDADDMSRVTDLLVENHFAECRALTCTHAKKRHQSLQTSDENISRHLHNEGWYADVILHFLSRSSCLQGEVLKEVVDPAAEDATTKLFNLKESQYPRLAERMLKAYHILAQSGRFVYLVKGSEVGDEHLLVDLPQQVCKRILLTEKIFAEKLKRQSKAEMVVIRRRPHRDYLAGLVLEAWGSFQSLQSIQNLISDEAKVKPSLFATGASRYAMENAHMTVFKNCSCESSPVAFMNYYGRCQPYHDQLSRHVPYLLCPHLEGSFGLEKFVEHSLRQVDLLNANYDGNLHGNIRAVISFGTLYVANCSTTEVLVSEFDGLFLRASSTESANPDTLHPRGRARGRRGRRPRGRGSFVPRQPPSYCQVSFIPTGNPYIDSARLQDFLQKNGFVLAEETVDYRVSLKLYISGQQLKMEAVVALDENFNLKYVNMPDFRWLCISIISASKDSDCRPYDCRFKIQSRTKQTVLQLRQETDNFADVIANHRAMLLRQGKEVYGIHRDFLSRVRFVRKKYTKVYRLAASQHAPTTDAFLYGMAIRINHGTEYSRPSPTGIFQDIDTDRVEVTATPELPDLHDDEEMKTFFTRCWQFAEELGSVLE